MPAGSKKMSTNVIKLHADVPRSLVNFIEKAEIGDRYKFPEDLSSDEERYRSQDIMYIDDGLSEKDLSDDWVIMLRVHDGFLVYSEEGVCITDNPYCFCPQESHSSFSYSRMTDYNDIRVLSQINLRYCDAELHDWSFAGFPDEPGNYWQVFLGREPDAGEFDSEEMYEFARFMCGEQDFYESETFESDEWLNLNGLTSTTDGRYYLEGFRGMFRKDGKVYAIGVDLDLVELCGGPYNFYLERMLDFYKFMKRHND